MALSMSLPSSEVGVGASAALSRWREGQASQCVSALAQGPHAVPAYGF